MNIEYAADKVFTQVIDIVDAGNTCLRCTNKDCEEFYLITKTIMGKTYFIKFGPVIPDLDELLDLYTLSFTQLDYKETKIEKEISVYINDPKKKIITVECIEPEEALPLLPDIITQ